VYLKGMDFGDGSWWKIFKVKFMRKCGSLGDIVIIYTLQFLKFYGLSIPVTAVKYNLII
jgi:hypothetical protein